MTTTEFPLASEHQENEQPVANEQRTSLPETRKPYVVPALMEPQDMLETTKFFFQVGGGGSTT